MKIALILCLFAATGRSQDPPAFHSQVELVALPCSVVDEHGAPVANLARENFRVFDNEVPRIVEYLWHDTDEPLTVAVLIDASLSQSELIAEHQRTAKELLRQLLRPGDRSFINSVGGSQSPIWDAIYDTAREKLQPLKGPKAILLLTDGFDNGSAHTWTQAVTAAQKAEAAVYAIQYRSNLGGSYAPELYRLVVESGGAWFLPPADDYSPILTRLENDLRRRYVLGFRPEKLTFKLKHEVRVEVSDPQLTVRARKTYYQ